MEKLEPPKKTLVVYSDNPEALVKKIIELLRRNKQRHPKSNY